MDNDQNQHNGPQGVTPEAGTPPTPGSGLPPQPAPIGGSDPGAPMPAAPNPNPSPLPGQPTTPVPGGMPPKQPNKAMMMAFLVVALILVGAIAFLITKK